MKVLFLVPPADFDEKGVPDRLYGCSYGYDYKPPLHLLTLATIAKKKGHDVLFLDCPAEKVDIRGIRRFLKNNTYDRAVFFTPYVATKSDIQAGRMCAEQWKNVICIYTGAQPTWKPESFFFNDRVLVIRGEPEEAFEKSLSNEDYDLSDLPGCSYLSNGDIHHVPRGDFIDLNTLPIPDRTLLKGHYRVNRLNVTPVTAMMVSRGCVYRCKFCAPHAMDQAIEIEYKKEQEVYKKRPPLRLRSVENVIKEFEEIHRLGYKGIEISDNMFVCGKGRTIKICKAIEHLGLEWLCLARADQLLDDDILEAMSRAGCKLIYMGTESFNQEILDDCQKDLKVECISQAVDKLRKHKIEPEVSVLMGASPLETKETIKNSVKEGLGLRTRFLHFGVMTPFPNSEYYDELKKTGCLVKDDYVEGDMLKEPMVNLPHVSGKEMMKIMRRAYIKQYLTPRAILSHVRKLGSFGDLAHRVKMLGKFIKYLIGR